MYLLGTIFGSGLIHICALGCFWQKDGVFGTGNPRCPLTIELSLAGEHRVPTTETNTHTN